MLLYCRPTEVRRGYLPYQPGTFTGLTYGLSGLLFEFVLQIDFFTCSYILLILGLKKAGYSSASDRMSRTCKSYCEFHLVQ